MEADCVKRLVMMESTRVSLWLLAVPTVERAPEEPPPFVVLVQGPPQVRPALLQLVCGSVLASCLGSSAKKILVVHNGPQRFVVA